MNSSMLSAQAIRRLILEMSYRAQASHLGSAFSCVDILAVMYSANSMDGGRSLIGSSSLIFSKGHAAMAQYATLAHFGLISEELLETYGKDGTILSGHVSHLVSPEIPLSTGSLGHGLPYGIGLALAFKKLGLQNRVFVLMSDGELDEGTTWESALLANQFKLDNLTVIVDRNRIQSLAETESTLALEPLAEKWAAFNWRVKTVNGHNHEEIHAALTSNEGPLCVLAETTKGFGVSFMENKVLWHYRPPNEAEYQLALDELGEKTL